MISELRHEAQAERSSMQQAMQHFEHLCREAARSRAGPGQERLADVQGHLSSLLLQLTALGRRVDGLDERLQTRPCEEASKVKLRQVEQQLAAQQRKAQLASATAEAMAKRQTARLWKVLQSLEEHASRISAVEQQASDQAGLEFRLSELEGRQSRLEDELQVVATGPGPPGEEEAPGSLVHEENAPGSAQEYESCSGGDDYSLTLRGLENDMSGLAQRTVTQLDSHAAALANLRIRTEGQEQRLATVAQRLETAVAPPVSALRSEITLLREQDRQDLEVRLAELAQRTRRIEETGEEVATELQNKVKELSSELRTCEALCREERPTVIHLAEAAAAQAQALRRLELAVAEPGQVAELFERVDALELQYEAMEKEQVLEAQQGRADVVRLDASLRELQEPLRRLSQRTAGLEASFAAFERRLEQLSQLQEASEARCNMEAMISTPSARSEGKVQEIADLAARVMDIEALLEGAELLRGGFPARLAGLSLSKSSSLAETGCNSLLQEGGAG